MRKILVPFLKVEMRSIMEGLLKFFLSLALHLSQSQYAIVYLTRRHAPRPDVIRTILIPVVYELVIQQVTSLFGVAKRSRHEYYLSYDSIFTLMKIDACFIDPLLVLFESNNETQRYPSLIHETGMAETPMKRSVLVILQ